VGTGLLGQRSHIHVVHVAQGSRGEQMEGPYCLWPRFPNNVSFAFQIQESQSNKKFGIEFKPKECGSELHLSYTNFAGWEPVIMIASIGNKLNLGKISLFFFAKV
jgi:hypothetical protein